MRPVVSDGGTHHWELVACDETIGMFAIDDNEDLADPALPRFLLEVKDLSISTDEHTLSPNDGWQPMTTQECIALLEARGIIEKL